MEKRTNLCPKCNYHLRARQDNKIICLNNSCDWEIDAKRQSDIEIPELTNLRREYNGG
jgi:predicted small metal-binding protein